MGKGSSELTKNASRDGALKNTPVKVIETTRFLSGSTSYGSGRRYRDEVLQAETDGKGNLTFTYAKPTDYGAAFSKTNKTTTATFQIEHGAVNGELYGINMSKVNSIAGQTYSLRQVAKDAGLVFDGKDKRWIRQR